MTHLRQRLIFFDIFNIIIRLKLQNRDSMELAMSIPGYRIVKLIGSGGMGDVYLAVQESLQRSVAIKVIRSHLAMDDAAVRRFLKEGTIVAKLTHPSIIKVFDTGIHQGKLYLAMEHLSGGTLKNRLAQGLSLSHKLGIFSTLLDALGHAHQQGIIHRDIKPQNILFYPQGIPVLSDFGIAKALTSETAYQTTSSAVIGSPRYMSPEQLRGESVDQRVDIYAMGVLFYELLMENAIYSSVTDPFALAFRHVSDPVPQLPEQFAVFQPVLDRLMAKNRDERFSDANHAAIALEKAKLNIDEIGYSTTRTVTKHHRIQSNAIPAKKYKSVAVFSLAAVAGLITVTVMGLHATRPSLTETSIIEPDEMLQWDKEISRVFIQATEQHEQGDYAASLAVIDESLQRWPNAMPLLALRPIVVARLAELEREQSKRQIAYERQQAIDGYQTRAFEYLESDQFLNSLAVLAEGLENWSDAKELMELRELVIQRRQKYLENYFEQQIEAELNRLIEHKTGREKSQ